MTYHKRDQAEACQAQGHPSVPGQQRFVVTIRCAKHPPANRGNHRGDTNETQNPLAVLRRPPPVADFRHEFQEPEQYQATHRQMHQHRVKPA